VKMWKFLDVGGRHLGIHDIQCGLDEDDEEEYGLANFGRQHLCSGLPSVYVSAQVNIFEKLNLTSSFWPSSKYFVDTNLSINLHLFKW